MIARQVLGQDDEVPAGLVLLAFPDALIAAAGHVHLAAEDGLEGLFSLLFPVLIDFFAVVKELLDTEHVAMVGEGHAAHSVGDSLVHHTFDGCLPVEQ